MKLAAAALTFLFTPAFAKVGERGGDNVGVS